MDDEITGHAEANASGSLGGGGGEGGDLVPWPVTVNTTRPTSEHCPPGENEFTKKPAIGGRFQAHTLFFRRLTPPPLPPSGLGFATERWPGRGGRGGLCRGAGV